MNKPAITPGRSLTSIIGAAAVAALYVIVPQFEGTIYPTYRDPVGVLTYCTGATENAIWGKVYTPAECKAQLDRDLAKHAEGISKCVNMDKLTNGQKVAFVDAAYNIGTSAFCGSSMARKANAGDMQGACDALLLWDKAGGKVWPGLTKRRKIEREYCMGVRKA